MGIDTRTTTLQVDTGRNGSNRVTVLLVVIAVILALTGAWLLLRPTADPNPNPQITPTASAAPSVSASVPTQTSVSPEQAAYAATEQSYRTWSGLVIQAYATSQPGLLQRAPATSKVIAAQAADVAGLWARFKGQIRATEDIRSIKPVSYSPDRLTISVCALRDTRFIDPSGKDVTVDRDAKPVPPSTKPLAQTVGFILDGATWRVSEYVIDPTDGVPC